MLTLLRPFMLPASAPIAVFVLTFGASSADAGLWWHWGHPGYADTAYYAPYGSWGASYGPGYSSYYGPAAGCCGSACGPCGCDPCGCGPCGYGGCPGGACVGGACGLNAAPADGAPVPDSNMSTPPDRSTTPPSDTAPPRRTFEDDAPLYEPPRRSRPSETTPMDDTFDSTFPPPRTGTDTTPPSNTAPSGLDDGFTPRPPSRRPAPVDPLDGTTNPTDSTDFGVRKPELPEGSDTVIPEAAPAETEPVKENGSADDDRNGPSLDQVTTTAPVISKTRLAIHGEFAAPKLVRMPLKSRSEWSAAPADARIARH